MRLSSLRRHRVATSAALAAAMLGLVTATTDLSYAAFTASAVNPANSVTVGTVAVSNDRSGTTVFTVASARPDAATSTLSPPAGGPWTAGSTASGGSACVKVSYTGSLTADIRLYATLSNTGADGGLGQFLLFNVDTGTDTAPGTDLSCAAYTRTASLHGAAANTTFFVDNMPGTYGAAVAGWAAATQGTTRWYRFSWLLPADAASAAQGEQVQATFTWEARSL